MTWKRIIETEDPEFIKIFIDDDKKRKEEKLGSAEIRYLLETTEDYDYIRKVLDDKEKTKELGLNGQM